MCLRTQLMPGFALRQQRHRRVTPAAGFPMAAHSHQHKPAPLPETPQLVGITKTHGEIIFTAGVQDQPLTNAFPLTTGMNRNAANPSAFSVAARGVPPCAASDCATRFPRGRREPAHTARLSSGTIRPRPPARARPQYQPPRPQPQSAGRGRPSSGVNRAVRSGSGQHRAVHKRLPLVPGRSPTLVAPETLQTPHLPVCGR